LSTTSVSIGRQWTNKNLFCASSIWNQFGRAKLCESFNDVETSPSGPTWFKKNDNNMLFTVVPIDIPRYEIEKLQSYSRPFNHSKGIRRPERLKPFYTITGELFFTNEVPWNTSMGAGNSIKILYYHVLLYVCMSIDTFQYSSYGKPCFI